MAVSDAKVDQLISTIEILAEEIKKSNEDKGGKASTYKPSRGVTNEQIADSFNPEALEKYNALVKEQRLVQQQINDELAKGELANRELIKASLERMRAGKQEIEQLERSAGALDKPKEAIKSLTNNFSDLASGISKLNLNTISGSFSEIASIGKDFKDAWDVGNIAAIESMMLDLGAAVEELALKVLEMFLQAIVDLATKFEDLERNIRKATGGSAEFAKDIRGLRNDVIMAGVSAEELAEAHTTLANTFTDYTMMGSQSRQEMLKVTSVLGELGASSADTAESFQNLTKGLGMTTSAAGQTLIEIEALGKDIGVSASKMASDFNKVSNNVLKLGSKGPQAFKDLAVAAKITGLEIEKITQMTDKFDTFDGAAEQVGKLNAALGGNFVNAMDLMMTTDPAERFSMIRDSILDAGLSFEEMSYHQKQFYADSLGLSSVSDLSKALSGDMDALNGSLGENSAEMEAAEKRAQSLQTFQESLQNLFASFVPVLSPVIDALQGMASWLSENAETIKKVTSLILILGGVILLTTTGPIGMVVGAVGLIIGVLMNLGEETSNVSKESSFLSSVIKLLLLPFKTFYKVLSNTFENLMAIGAFIAGPFIAAWNFIEPAITMVVDAFIYLYEAIEPLYVAYEELMLTGALTALLYTLGVTIASIVVPAVISLAVAAGSFIATVVLPFLVAAAPFIAAALAIGAAFMLLKTLIVENFDRIKEAYLEVFSPIIELYDDLVVVFSPIGDMLSSAADSFSSFFDSSSEGMDIMGFLGDALVFLVKQGFLPLKITIEIVVFSIRQMGKLLVSAKDNVMDLFSAFALVGSAFEKLFSGDLSGMFDDLGLAFSKAFLNPFIRFINVFVSMINGVIGIIMDSPLAQWLGEKIGVDTSSFRIPELTPFATGGIVEGPTPALVGEAGPEAIIPLDKLQTFISPIVNNPVTQMIQQATSGMFQGGPKEITVYLTLDGKVIDKKIVDVMNQKAVDSLRGF